ncbi:MAG: hypothetical protein JWM80_4036 [Cyanobacteria bacterium RYN_339]|nr:hypothetical protein [Cyanobacteria bacterium RYN_339]
MWGVENIVHAFERLTPPPPPPKPPAPPAPQEAAPPQARDRATIKDGSGKLAEGAERDWGPMPFPASERAAEHCDEVQAEAKHEDEDFRDLFKNDCAAGHVWREISDGKPDEMTRMTKDLAAGDGTTLPSGVKLAALTPGQEDYVKTIPPQFRDRARFELSFMGLVTHGGTFDPKTGEAKFKIGENGTEQTEGVLSDDARKAAKAAGLDVLDPKAYHQYVSDKVTEQNKNPHGPKKLVEDLYVDSLQQQLNKAGGDPLTLTIRTAKRDISDVPHGMRNELGANDFNFHHQVAVDGIKDGQVYYHDENGVPQHQEAKEFSKLITTDNVETGTDGVSTTTNTAVRSGGRPVPTPA